MKQTKTQRNESALKRVQDIPLYSRGYLLSSANMVCNHSFSVIIIIYSTWYTNCYMARKSCAGTCYGFQVMRMHESPNIPFTVLYERFKEGVRCTIT